MDPQTVVIRREKPGIRQEISVIPTWAYILAVVIFLVIPICFFGFVWPHEGNPYSQVMRIVIPFIPATFLAFFALLVGYVNRDSGRRGMSRALWTFVVVVVPNAIGFILYFLLRNPIRTNCPKCGAAVDLGVNYCPTCRYSFHPTCPQCKSPVRPNDTFCSKCGSQLEQSGV
jgi:hypothetical protein